MFITTSKIQAGEIDTINFYLDIETDNAEFVSNIEIMLEIATNQLLAQGYNINFVDTLSNANIAVFAPRLPPEGHNPETNHLIIEPLTPQILLPSTILFENSEYSVDFFSLSTLTQEDYEERGLLNIVVGLATYSVGDCSNADLMIEIRQSSSLANYAINFYYGNCMLLIGDYESAFQGFRNGGASLAAGGGTVVNSKHASINYVWTSLQLAPDLVDIEYVTYIRDYLLNCGYEIYCQGRENEEQQVDLTSRRARLLALTFDYDWAIADLDRAIEIAEDNNFDNQTLAELYTIRGEIIFLIYEWDRVEENFNMAIELDPDYAPAYFQRGILFYTMTRREYALSDFETYLELEPDGIHAEEAQANIESIQIEIEALNG